MTKTELLNQTMECPHCEHGVSGTDHYGEAIDCHNCDGNGVITVAFIEDAVRARCEQAGDLMIVSDLLHQVLNESGSVLSQETRDRIDSFLNPIQLA